MSTMGFCFGSRTDRARELAPLPSPTTARSKRRPSISGARSEAILDVGAPLEVGNRAGKVRVSQRAAQQSAAAAAAQGGEGNCQASVEVWWHDRDLYCIPISPVAHLLPREG